MKKPAVYISGKITGLDYQQAFANFERAEKFLIEQGFEPVNPMKKVSEQEGKTWKEYMLEDIAMLWDCDAIYLLSNWTDSRGAKIEYVIARQLELKIVFERWADEVYRLKSLLVDRQKNFAVAESGTAHLG